MQKQYRIKKKKEIEKLIFNKKSISNLYFVIYYKKSETNKFRFAISVSKKIGNAVYRNKIKRRIREIIRLSKDYISDYDFFIIVRSNIKNLDFNQTKINLLDLMKKKIMQEVTDEKEN